jgi:dTDP-4-amino-4,6-dideoxygalactose transaminase
VAAFATRTGLTLIEDACQAQGSRDRERHAGTLGDVGCFSLKDRKLLASGEGGYLLTDRDDIAAHAAAFRSHWHTGAPGAPVGSRLAYNFRLAEPLAALARRHAQTQRLYELVGDTPGLARIEPGPAERPNDYSPVWRIDHPRPRGFAEHLARRGVLNSVGTFGLRAAPTHPACQTLNPAPCPNAAGAVDRLLAVVVHAGTTPAALERMAATIRKEAVQWATTA